MQHSSFSFKFSPTAFAVITACVLATGGALVFSGASRAADEPKAGQPRPALTVSTAQPQRMQVPLMAAIARQVVEDAWRDYEEELTAMRFRGFDSVRVLLHDCRHSLMVAVLAGLGRAMSEVGAVMIVGGNIDRSTRTMTTAIALETSKGDLPLALALGLILLVVVLALNVLIALLRRWRERRDGAALDATLGVAA